MLVTKRNGKQEPFMFNKIVDRIVRYNYGSNIETEIVLNLNNRIYSGILTSEIDKLIAEIAIKMSNIHPNYARLASNIALNNIYKQVDKSFSETMRKIYAMKASLLADKVYEIICKYKEVFDSEIEHANDLR